MSDEQTVKEMPEGEVPADDGEAQAPANDAPEGGAADDSDTDGGDGSATA